MPVAARRDVAVVTGASSGIGAAVARALADEGVGLGLASRSGDDLGIADAVAGPCDVRDRGQVEALVGATVERCVAVRDRVEPEPAWREAYEHGYARFRRLYPALRPLEDE